MDISVPSRFACLKIEDDDFRPANSKQKKKPEKLQPKKIASTSQQPPKVKSVPSQKPTSSQPNAKKGKKSKTENEKQWEEWKKRDDELVNDNFQQQLQSAILQSKLDYEKHKKNPVGKGDSDQAQGKKKKLKTMSLDQFLDEGKENGEKDVEKSSETERNFFKEIIETTKQEITREKVEESRKKRQENFDEAVSLVQCQEKLQLERLKNAELEKEVDTLKEELALVKNRNKTLYSMLCQGEMKDKAAVLQELEQLTTVKQDLTEEVSRLHRLLEQERSNKTGGLSDRTDRVDKIDRIDGHSKHSKDKKQRKKN